MGKDEDRPVVFHDMVELIPTQGTYLTQHNSPQLGGTQGRVEKVTLCGVLKLDRTYLENSVRVDFGRNGQVPKYMYPLHGADFGETQQRATGKLVPW